MKYVQFFKDLKVTVMGNYTKMHLENFPKNLFGKTLDRLESLIALKPFEAPHRSWCHSGVFIVNFEHILHLVLVFLLLTLNL